MCVCVCVCVSPGAAVVLRQISTDTIGCPLDQLPPPSHLQAQTTPSTGLCVCVWGGKDGGLGLYACMSAGLCSPQVFVCMSARLFLCACSYVLAHPLCVRVPQVFLPWCLAPFPQTYLSFQLTYCLARAT